MPPTSVNRMQAAIIYSAGFNDGDLSGTTRSFLKARGAINSKPPRPGGCNLKWERRVGNIGPERAGRSDLSS